MKDLPPLMLISDAGRVGEERFLAALEAALAAGLCMVQMREHAWSLDRLRRLTEAVLERSQRVTRRVLVLINRRPEDGELTGAALAGELHCAGIQVGGGDTALVGSARAALPPGSIVGYSAHGEAEIARAAGEGADFVTYSPVFGGISKEHPLPPLGLAGLEAASRATQIPIYALGGVRPEHAAELRQAGAAGAAVIGSILDASDPAAAVERFLDGWAAGRP